MSSTKSKKLNRLEKALRDKPLADAAKAKAGSAKALGEMFGVSGGAASLWGRKQPIPHHLRPRIVAFISGGPVEATIDRPLKSPNQIGEGGASPSPVAPAPPKEYDGADLLVLTASLRRRPGFIPWMLGLLRILERGDGGSTSGITANINAFLGDLHLDKVRPPLRGRKRREG